MFRVITPTVSQEFVRWTDALNAAKALIPECKSWLADIRIFYGEELIWVYSKSHKFPQYIGPGTYNRLAKLFLLEALEEEQAAAQAGEGDQDSQPG